MDGPFADGAHFLDSLQGLPTLKAFGRSSAEQNHVAAVGEAFRQRTMKVLKFAFLSGLVLEFMTALAIALIAVTLRVRLVTGNLPFEEGVRRATPGPGVLPAAP